MRFTADLSNTKHSGGSDITYNIDCLMYIDIQIISRRAFLIVLDFD